MLFEVFGLVVVFGIKLMLILFGVAGWCCLCILLVWVFGCLLVW